jgi:hypothetical protein
MLTGKVRGSFKLSSQQGFGFRRCLLEGSSAAYDQLIELVANDLPDVAEEVRAEIGRGRSVYASHIEPEDRKLRQQLLSEEDLGRIRKSDVAVESYDSDERLVVLLEALQTLAASMSATRRALGHFGRQHELQSPYVVFVNLDEAEPVRFTTATDIASITGRLDEAAATIGAAVRAVREFS